MKSRPLHSLQGKFSILEGGAFLLRLLILFRSIIPEKPQVALEAVKLMAAVCLVPPDGHDATLASISEAGDTREVDRFQPIVQGSVSLHSCLVI